MSPPFQPFYPLRDNSSTTRYLRAVSKMTLRAIARVENGGSQGVPEGGGSAAADEALFKPTERFYLNADSPVPLYYQMEKIILDRISAAGVVGARLPREMDLVKIFGVSRITVKKVTDSLAARGLIRRRLRPIFGV